MAYGLKYFAEYNRQGGALSRLEIYEDGFTITPIEIECESVVFDWGKKGQEITDHIRACQLKFGLVAKRGRPTTGFDYDLDFDFDEEGYDLDFSELYTNDETKFQVRFYRDKDEFDEWVLYFMGYVMPDVYNAPYKDPSYVINFTATDRYNVLNRIEYEHLLQDGNLSITNILFNVRSLLKLTDLPVYSMTGVQETKQEGLNPNVINKIWVRSKDFFKKEIFKDGTFENKSTGDILANICRPFFNKFFQFRGSLYFMLTNAPAFPSFTKYLQEDINTYSDSIETGSQDYTLQLIDGYQDGRPIYNNARIVHRLGETGLDDVDNLISDGSFDSWFQMKSSGKYRWLLNDWRYSDGITWNDNASRGHGGNPTDNFVVMHGRESIEANLEYIESSIIVSKKVYNVQGISLSMKFKSSLTENSKEKDYQEYLRDNPCYAVIQIMVGADTEADDYYLAASVSGAISWEPTPQFIRLRHFSEEVWVDFFLNNLVIPIEEGYIKIRLCNTLQTGSTNKYRFVSGYDDIKLSATVQDQLEDASLYYRESEPTNYSSPFEDYEVVLGDGVNDLSNNVLIWFNEAGTESDLTRKWFALAPSGSITTKSSQKLLQMTLLYITRNVFRKRIRLTGIIRTDDLSPLRPVVIDGKKYRINYFSLNDYNNRFTVELEEVFV